jgi:hypothetical protein
MERLLDRHPVPAPITAGGADQGEHDSPEVGYAIGRRRGGIGEWNGGCEHLRELGKAIGAVLSSRGPLLTIW